MSRFALPFRQRALIPCALLLVLACFVGGASAESYSRQGAARYIQANDYAGLAQYATAWTRAEPNSADAWGYLGMAYGLHLHQPEKAADAINRSLRINPNQPPGWNALGATYVDLKQYDNAVHAFQRAIQLNPNQPTYWNDLAVAYSDKADWNGAMRTLDQEEPLARRLNTAPVWYMLGNGYLKLQNSPKSVAAYQHCIQLKPNLAPCWTNMGVMLQWAGNNAAALQAYARGKALGDALAGEDAARLQQVIAAQRQAATSGQRTAGQEAAFLNNAFRQQALKRAENRP